MAYLSCCGYFSLRTVCIITGITTLLIDITSIPFYLYFLREFGRSTGEIDFFIVVIIINIISNVIMIIGSAIQRRSLLLPWLILNSALDLFYGTLTIVTIVISIIEVVINSIVKDEFYGHQISGVKFWAPFLLGLSLLIMMVAFIHWLFHKVVTDHLLELRKGVQCRQYDTIVNPNGIVNVFKHGFVPDSSAFKTFFVNEKPV